MIEKYDKAWIGFILGLVLPVIIYFLYTLGVKLLFEAGRIEKYQWIFAKSFRDIVAVVFNVIPFFIFNQMRRTNLMRGVLGATVLLGVLIVFFGKDLF